MRFEIPTWLKEKEGLTDALTLEKGQPLKQGDIIPIITEIGARPGFFRIDLIEDFGDYKGRETSIRTTTASSLEISGLTAYHGLAAEHKAGKYSDAGIGPRLHIIAGLVADHAELVGFDGLWRLIQST